MDNTTDTYLPESPHELSGSYCYLYSIVSYSDYGVEAEESIERRLSITGGAVGLGTYAGYSSEDSQCVARSEAEGAVASSGLFAECCRCSYMEDCSYTRRR